MYDLPDLRWANDRLWSAIAVYLRRYGMSDVPERLDRGRSLEAIWDDPRLLVAQTCGYPLMTRWRDRLTYVATPSYEVEGCEHHHHRSRFIVREDDLASDLGALAGRRAAINDIQSNTGMNLLRHAVAPMSVDGRFFSDVVATGSHASSLQAVVTGAADVAAIDAVTFDHLVRENPFMTGRTRTIGWSRLVPNLPFVTGRATDPAVVALIRSALGEGIKTSGEAARSLRLKAVEDVGIAAYDVVEDIEESARHLGYPALR